MAKLRLPVTGLITALFVTGSLCVYAESRESRLDSLVIEALANNPGIRSSYHAWQAVRHKVKQVQGMPDPTAHYTYLGESVETKVGPQEHKYGVTQKVPFPGKLYLKGKTESKYAEMMREKYEAAKREVIKDLKFTYFDFYWVDKAISITEEEKSVLENLEKVARRKYESNITPVQDVVKAQVELSRIIDKLLVLNRERRGLEARINALLNRPGATPFAEISGVELYNFDYGLEALHEIAGRRRQELIAADLEIQRAKYERSLSGLAYLPDFSFGFDYIQVGDNTTTLDNDGRDAWMTTFAVHIPIWLDKQVAGVREKQAALSASRENYESVKNSVTYEVEDVYYKILAYKDIVDLYETALVPQTEQAFEAARTAYESDKVDFLNWLDAERVLLQTRLAYHKAIADYEKSIAYLERVVGRDL